MPAARFQRFTSTMKFHDRGESEKEEEEEREREKRGRKTEAAAASLAFLNRGVATTPRSPPLGIRDKGGFSSLKARAPTTTISEGGDRYRDALLLRPDRRRSGFPASYPAALSIVGTPRSSFTHARAPH